MDEAITRQLDLIEPRVGELGKDITALKGLLAFDIPSALNKTRFIAEKILAGLCKEHEVSWGKGEPTIERMIGPLVAKGVIPKNVAPYLRTVQANASPGSHFQEDPLSKTHLAVAVTALIAFLAWRFQIADLASEGSAAATSPLVERPRSALVRALSLALLAVAGVLAYVLLGPVRGPASGRVVEKSLEAWLEGQGFLALPSPEQSWAPGSILWSDGRGVLLAVGAEDLPAGAPSRAVEGERMIFRASGAEETLEGVGFTRASLRELRRLYEQDPEIRQRMQRRGSGQYLAVVETFGSARKVHGVRLASLSVVASTLGEGERDLGLELLTVEAARRLVLGEEAGEETGGFGSEFKVFGLLIAQGNYRDGGAWWQGRLPSALRSADLVERRLLAMGAAPENIVKVQSRMLDSNTFDPEARLTRADLVGGVERLLRLVRSKARPEEHRLVLVYYFGHGIVDDFARQLYLVPEAFIDRTPSDPLATKERLFALAGLLDRLGQVTEQGLVLMDACRSVESELPDWSRTTLSGQRIVEDLKGMAKIAKHLGGFFGPHVVFTGSEDGRAAGTVPFLIDGIEEQVGPVAVCFDALFEERRALDWPQLIAALREPVPLMQGEARAYTALTKAYAEDLPAPLVLDLGPRPVARRGKPFGAEDAKPPAPKFRNSGARLLRAELLTAEDDLIADFAAASDGRLLVMTENGRLLMGPSDKLAPLAIEAQGSRLESIGAAGDDFYFHSQLEYSLSLIDRGGALQILDDDAYVARFSETRLPGAALVLTADATVGLKDELLRIRGRERALVTKALDLTGIVDLVELAAGELVFTRDDDTRVRRFVAGQESASAELIAPRELAVDASYVYALSESGRFLYRLNDKLESERLDLLDLELGERYKRSPVARGFAVDDDGRVFIAAGPRRLVIDISKARWSSD